MGPLGRLTPPDFRHVEKYPLAAAPITNAPVVIGIPWFSNFDHPVLVSDGSYWIGRGPLGYVRGGHCVCLEPVFDPQRVGHEHDTLTFYRWFDQGVEGACVGFGCSRAMALDQRHRLDGFWLYDQARKLEGRFPDGEGANVRSGLEILRTKGHVIPAPPAQRVCSRGEADRAPDVRLGISAYRWATSVAEVLAALGTPTLDYVTVLQSWGTSYPQRVKMPATVLARLLAQDGEAGVVVPR